MALNGFVVHLVDLDGFGYSGGTRVVGLSIDRYHHNVATALIQAGADLPCYLLGHSMGAMVVNTFLDQNPEVADKLAGVIYSAPFFGLTRKIDSTMKMATGVLAKNCDEICLVSGMPVHRTCRNKFYIR